MIVEEKVYNEQEYEGLVLELLQSSYVGKELPNQKSAVLFQNPLFYPMMFRAVDKMRDFAKLEGNRRLIANLEDFEVKLMEHTNIFPVNLPDEILADRDLVVTFLSDYPYAEGNDAGWLKFKNKIFDHFESLPSEMKLTFLGWCVNMLNMNLQKHKKTCSSKTCPQEKLYEKRNSFFNKLIDETKPQPALEIEIAENQPGLEHRPTNKIQWLGSQRQLAELFAVLKMKGWIEKFEYETIKECFTESNTIQQYLKPGINKETGEATYPEIFKTNYDERFYTIKKNQSSD